jgi:hypothetical protein
MNHICGGVNDDTSIWHSRLCHINFGLMSRLSSMSLIPKFTIAKGSKCHSCVQSKQPRKPHTAAEERNLAPLELIHSDLCEMNGVLTNVTTANLITNSKCPLCIPPQSLHNANNTPSTHICLLTITFMLHFMELDCKFFSQVFIKCAS